MARRISYLLFAAFVLVGCGKAQSDLMPLKVGRSSTYEVTAGFDKMVDPIKVARELPVADTTGYELTSTFGTSRLAWKNGELLASETANAFFNPPIPLVTDDGKDRSWSGRIEAMGKKTLATATLTQKKGEDLQIAAKRYTTQSSELKINLPRGTIVINSWFVPKIGLVQQEQRTNDKFVLRLELLHGPNPGE